EVDAFGAPREGCNGVRQPGAPRVRDGYPVPERRARLPLPFGEGFVERAVIDLLIRLADDSCQGRDHLFLVAGAQRDQDPVLSQELADCHVFSRAVTAETLRSARAAMPRSAPIHTIQPVHSTLNRALFESNRAPISRDRAAARVSDWNAPAGGRRSRQFNL